MPIVRRPILTESLGIGAFVCAAAGVLAGSSLAYVCHPGVAGTKMLTLRGSVVSLRTAGRHATFVVRSTAGACTSTVWNTATGTALAAPSVCPVVRKPASAGNVAPIGVPLPIHPQTLVSSGGIAVVSARGQGVFAVRLSDGLFGFLGPDGGGFAPRFDAQGGVLFHDGESKLALRQGRTVVEHLTRAAVAATIARTARPLVTGGPIRSLSMDGLRVALAVGDTSGRCDRVLYWNVAWNPAQRVSAPSGPTCLVRPQGVEIPSVAIGGFRAEWLVTQNGASRLIAGSPLCQEWVLGRYGTTGAVSALAGDGATLAFAAGSNGRTIVSVVNGKYRPVAIASGSGRPTLAADGTRVAILWPNGRLELRSRSGVLLGTWHTAGTTIALQGRELVTLGSGRLEVYVGGALVHTWRVPASARGVDLQNGLAAFAAGSRALVLDTRTGHIAVVARAPSALIGVQIESPGLAYAWSTGSRGTARFLTMRQVELALGLR